MIVPIFIDEYIEAGRGYTICTLLYSQLGAQLGQKSALLDSKFHALSTPPQLNIKEVDQTQIKEECWTTC